MYHQAYPSNLPTGYPSSGNPSPMPSAFNNKDKFNNPKLLRLSEQEIVILFRPFIADICFLWIWPKQDENSAKEGIYILIRRLDILERAFIKDLVDSEKYESGVEKILSRYKHLAGIVRSFQIDDFIREWDLSTCQYAVERIKKGFQKSQSNSNDRVVFIKITDAFYLSKDTLYMMKSRPVISNLKGPIEELISILEKNSKLFKHELSELREIKNM